MREDEVTNQRDVSELRDRLAGKTGREYWRCLEELAAGDEFPALLRRAFPRQASELSPALDRRGFLTLLGGSLALAGLTGCEIRPPQRHIVPFVTAPSGIIPGKPVFYATAFALSGYAVGGVVTVREGRPVKVDGNADHPASLGSTDAIMQASLLDLYEPNRAQNILYLGTPNTWNGCVAALFDALDGERATGGTGIRILTGAVTSPTLYDQIDTLLHRFPGARWCQYESINRANVHAGAQQAFGRPVSTVYHFERAERILSLDGDFLLTMPGHVVYARTFAGGRRIRAGSTQMNRLYVVESMPTITGAMADHRMPARASEMHSIAWAIAQALGVGAGPPDGRPAAPAAPGAIAQIAATIPNAADRIPLNTTGLGTAADAQLAAETRADWVVRAVRDLQAHQGASVVVPGDFQPPEVHALAHAMNEALGAVGTTVTYTEPVEYVPAAGIPALQELVDDMMASRVTMLLILGGSPVYDAPADVPFAEALTKVSFSLYLGRYADETAELCQWHVPEQHYLEAWGDVRAHDGTITIQQPMIEPLYADTRSAHEILAAVLAPPGMSSHDAVRGYWQRHAPRGNFEDFWRRCLHDGLVAGSTSPPLSDLRARPPAAPPPSPQQQPGTLEVIFRPDPTIWDGRFTNNGWLQELPKPLSKLTWDNAAIMSIATANHYGIRGQQLVTLNYEGRSMLAAAWILPGHPDGAVTITLGYGRTRAGGVGTGTGFNASAIRTAAAPWFDTGMTLAPTTQRDYELAVTHSHHTMEGRDLVRFGDISVFRRDPDFAKQGRAPDNSPMILDESVDVGYAWAMGIDTTVCIGCSACVIACQAENNIPIVGKNEVVRGREMHWLRIDRYYVGADADRPVTTLFQPIPCMHCEKAPCELVCPVEATVHDSEGLNEMIYNRCVGTRFCSNNCPYKVRRFNFLHYPLLVPVIELMRNPEVTVRSRGVMEKCSYCIQRIKTTEIVAEEENRLVRDGEIQTACEQACPTRAITFGSKNDPTSAVTGWKNQPHNYTLLAELGTRPRTSYLARLHNAGNEEVN